jgi:predicted nucleic acid-binding Zn ribbon protein
MNFRDDYLDDRDDPQPEDIEDLDRDDDDDEDEGRRCPACGQYVYAGVPKCSHCGEWIMEDTPAGRRAQTWLWPTVVALLIAIMLVMWHGLGR